jgi:omega-hydroxy-beta-dihydromenaquinone-9 sulfotransferase
MKHAVGYNAWKRSCFVAGFILVLFFLEVFTWFFLLMDHVIFPKFKKVVIKSPVFIIGMTRTGTTHLYRTLSLDNHRFTSMKLWEIIFAPSITQRKMISLIGRVRFLRNGLSKKVAPFIESAVFKNISNIHETRFHLCEEDEFAFLHLLATGTLSFAFPRLKSFTKLAQFDDLLSESRKKQIMKFYRGIIKRHLYVHGPETIYLAKSASHTPKINSFKEYFPDSRVICLLRDPVQVIGSTLSLFRAIRESFYVPVSTDELVKGTLALADHWFSYPLRMEKQTGNSFIFFMKYKELVNDLEYCIRSLYSEFNFEMSDDFTQKLNIESKKRFISKHHYSLEEFSLNQDDIISRYGFIYSKL